MVSKETSSVGYMVHLDGIRAFAIGGVILEHWASGLPRQIREIVARLDLAGWGVECFFVLSGFLITLLLLNSKSKHQSFTTALGHFYSRRALRIFPAYYLVLLIGIMTYPPMRDFFGWHAFYLSNLYPLWHDTFTPVGAHFWSLAVEEQFYLFWPLVVLLVPTRKVMYIALALCVLAPLTRLALWYAMGGIHLSMWTFPTTAFDLLGFGSFLACVKHQFGLAVNDVFVRRIRLAGFAALLVYIAALSELRGTVEFAVLARSLLALIFGALILHASFGFTGPTKHLLGNRLVVWLGAISYGLYLFHLFVPALYLHALGMFGLSSEIWGVYYIHYPLLLALLLAITVLSFYFWEQPIRRYRRYFA